MPRKKKPSAEAAVRDIRRKTRRRFSAEEKIRFVLEDLRAENRQLEEVVAEITLDNRLLKKSLTASGEEDDT